jgi:hypothetical protein
MNDPEHSFMIILLVIILGLTTMNAYFILKLLEIIEGGGV